MSTTGFLLLLCFIHGWMPNLVVEASVSSKASSDELPLYYGWFVETDYSFSFLNRSRKLLADTLQEVPDFLENVQQFTKQVYISDILLHYTREKPEEVLHCTTMYNGVFPNYTDGAQEYANCQVVKDNVNQPSVLHSIGWILTPRTFGARLKLTASQLMIWNQNDTEGNPPLSSKNAQSRVNTIQFHKAEQFFRENTTGQDPDVIENFQPTFGNGSRAHLTLGCAPGVGAVTTGWDLVDIIRLEALNSSNVKTYDLQDGWLRNYGDGQWVFYPTKQWLLESTFLGYQDPVASGSQQILISFSVLFMSCIISIFFICIQELW